MKRVVISLTLAFVFLLVGYFCCERSFFEERSLQVPLPLSLCINLTKNEFHPGETVDFDVIVYWNRSPERVTSLVYAIETKEGLLWFKRVSNVSLAKGKNTFHYTFSLPESYDSSGIKKGNNTITAIIVARDVVLNESKKILLVE